MAVKTVTEPISYRQASLKAWGDSWWGVKAYNFHGTTVPREAFPWVVRVFNTLVDNDSPKKLKRKAAKAAMMAVQAML